MALLVCLSPIGRLRAQSEANNRINLSVQIGFDGQYKSEYWVPVQTIVSNDGPALEGVLQVVVGSPGSAEEVRYTNPISLPTGSNKQQTFFIFLPGLTSDVTVRLLDENEVTRATSSSTNLRLLANDDLLYGVITTDPAEFTVLEAVGGSRGDAAVAYLAPRDLPSVPSGWNSLDVLILHNFDSGQLSNAQLESMESWLNLGGQLVISGGIGWQETVSNLSSMLPVAIIGTETWTDLPSLVNYTGIPLRDPGPYLVTNSFLTDGEAILIEEGSPLLAKREFGRGNVFFLALDPALPPMKDWDGSDLIWSEVANAIPADPVWANGATNGYSATNAVTSLPSLTYPSALQLSLFLVLYIVIIGPVNYYLLRRTNRRELAWLTIPSFVLIFSIIAYLVGFNLKGDETIINQLSIAYGPINGDSLRVQSLIGLYSPTRDTYDLTLPGDANARPFSQTFRGLTGSGNIDSIERSMTLNIKGIRIDISDVETFVADSYQTRPGLSSKIDLVLEGDEFVAEIEASNTSDIEFENVTLLLGPSAISLGDISPGEVKSDTIPFSTAMNSSYTPGVTVSVPPGVPTTSPLMANYGTILGATDFYNNREIYPRWQLLDSISYETARVLPLSTEITAATLIAWSNDQQLQLLLDDKPIDSAATTLYFLEVPINNSILEAKDIRLPIEMISWRVTNDSGIQNPGIDGYYFSPGWVDFEFAPWSQVSNLHVTDFGIAIEGDGTQVQQEFPQAFLWNWVTGTWDPVGSFAWGINRIPEPGEYLGPDLKVRLRLENNSNQGVQIRSLRPLYSGDMG